MIWYTEVKSRLLTLSSRQRAISGNSVNAEWEAWRPRAKELTKKQESLNELAFVAVLFSCSVISDSLQPHGLQYTRLLCPPPSPGVCSNSCLSSRWCHPTISSSVAPFFSYPQSFPALGSFPVSQLFTSGGQSIGASVSVLPINIQGWWTLGLTGLFSLLSKGFSTVFSSTALWKHQFFGAYDYIPIRIESRVLKRYLYTMFLAALSTIVKKWKQPKCLPMGEWI